jgi:hypothetical protein
MSEIAMKKYCVTTIFQARHAGRHWWSEIMQGQALRNLDSAAWRLRVRIRGDLESNHRAENHLPQPEGE